MANMGAKLNLDKLDLQIIHHMMENAEISYADLGKKLFVSGGTIHVRIKKLEEAGVVKGTRLKADLRLMGYDVIAENPRDCAPELYYRQLQHVCRNRV